MDKIDTIVRALYYVHLPSVQHNNDSEAWNFILDCVAYIGDINTTNKHMVSERLVKLLKQGNLT